MYKHFNINTRFRIAKESNGIDRFTEKQILSALANNEAHIDNGFIIHKTTNKIMAAPPNYMPTMTQELHERMNGLASVKQIQDLNNSLDILITDWLKEGFDQEDILTFITQRTKEIINHQAK